MTTRQSYIAPLVGVILALLFAASCAQAHESRPAYLGLTEVAPGQFAVLWRTPLLAGARLPVALKLPDTVTSVREPIEQELADSVIERRTIATGADGLAGARFEFPGLQLTITDVLVRVEMLDGRQSTYVARASQPWVEIEASQSTLQVASAYLKLGIEHILGGLDHLLFILVLLILVKGTARLVATVTAFTIAHSITLAAATLGVVHVPAAPVEAAIALSIVFIASEIVHSRQGRLGLTERWPWLVAFIFGLLHGLGFAGALSEVGVPQDAIPVALLFFNLGVEVGQLLFIAAVLAAITLIGKLARSAAVSTPIWAWRVPPYAIGGIAAFWLVQRVAAFAH